MSNYLPKNEFGNIDSRNLNVGSSSPSKRRSSKIVLTRPSDVWQDEASILYKPDTSFTSSPKGLEVIGE